MEREIEEMHALPAEAIRKQLAEFSPTAKQLHHATLRKLRALEVHQADLLHERDHVAKALAAAARSERKATQVAADAWAALDVLRTDLNVQADCTLDERQSLAAAINQVRETLLRSPTGNENGQSRPRATNGIEQGNGTATADCKCHKLPPGAPDRNAVASAPAAVAGGCWDATHQPTPFSAFCGTMAGLGGLALAEHALSDLGALWGVGAFGFSSHHDVLLFVGAFGALSALLYGAPSAPLGRPQATIGGFALVISLSMALHYANLACGAALGHGVCLPPAVEKVLAPALGIAAMLRWLTVHPPAAACAIQYMMLAEPQLQGPTFLLAPALLGATWMLMVQWLVARALRRASVHPADKADGSGSDRGAAGHTSASVERRAHGSRAIALL